MMHPRHSAYILNAPLMDRGMQRASYARHLSIIIVRIAFATIIVSLLYSVMASAQEQPREWQSLSSIRMTVERYVRDAAGIAQQNTSTLTVTTSELDPRLQLAHCTSALTAFTLNGAPLGARNTIAVRCPGENGAGWTVYVPTLVSIDKSVYVLKHSLPRDAHIGADDVEAQKHRVPGLGDTFFSDLGALRDQHLRRSVAAGAMLTSDMLTRDFLVKRGQEVALVFGTDDFAVRATGIALADGGLSDRIRVQNRSSLKVVEGTVESGNLVRVGM